MRSDRPLSKHTLNLYAGDYRRVKDLFPNGDAAQIIRDVLHTFLDKVEQGNDTIPSLPVNI